MVHAADSSFPECHAYNEMTNIGGWRKRNQSANPEWYCKHGKLVPYSTQDQQVRMATGLPFQM